MQPSGWTGWEVMRKEGKKEHVKGQKTDNLVTCTHSTELNRIQLKKINREKRPPWSILKPASIVFAQFGQ